MNSVTLIGRLTKDAELVQLENYNRSVVKFILAVGRDFASKTGEREADFIPVSYWSNYGSKLLPYLKKGRLIGVNGKIITKSYTKDDIRKYFTTVEADKVQFLDSEKEALA
ncbi:MULTISPECIES: single-stranded DNA-binding protein [Clostridium]|uniref:Single-stranded DNA-binding protein n=2 Tax=Clostridium TaxID=1485 RepID=D8GQG0_CLOLD|nr:MULTISPECIES: single-stranded DNA-binding protein [Clostridium]ADK14083.1 single-stranded DNA-binding protein [Clostridium ljungdahlii DSM 13528]AGY77308.1 single-stranded DNA-binding protein [Clostridium autoethanogenum DSM 10061]ALU37450.1 Single-strand binding protein [Clostridium autoethanogenum DSM 10061]OAA86239.1 Single-stranded DNA-binding protein ssb [Clostridium ljungdahlii DSM 13528]OVY49097.1 Single-stranded DNA-binding protein ssb [Clostridium autoethanogenum]